MTSTLVICIHVNSRFTISSTYTLHLQKHTPLDNISPHRQSLSSKQSLPIDTFCPQTCSSHRHTLHTYTIQLCHTCNTYVVFQVYYMCTTCVLHMYLLHIYYTCVFTHVEYIHVLHLQFYICNMYEGYTPVLHLCNICSVLQMYGLHV